MTQPKSIQVVGSVNIDFVVRTKTLPRAGETIGGGTFATVPGGKGANQALAARRLGARTYMNACVGDDAYAEIALQNLREAEVDLTGIKTLTGETTGAAFISVSDDAENQIALASGANLAFRTEHVSTNPTDAIIAQLEVPSDVVWDAVKRSKAFFALNTAPVQPVSVELLTRADLLVMNELEKSYYTDQLSNFDGLIAETYGAKGAAILKAGRKLCEAMPPPVDVVDTTGAGDCFTAALTLALVEGQSPQSALEFACAAGALATTRLGAQSALPTRQQVDSLLSR